MSGGSYDYAFGRVQDMADALRSRSRNDPRRMAFVHLLDRVAKAMRDIEWVDSGDTSPGDEHEAIDRCLQPGDTLRAATRHAEEAMAILRDTLAATPAPPGPTTEEE